MKNENLIELFNSCNEDLYAVYFEYGDKGNYMYYYYSQIYFLDEEYIESGDYSDGSEAFKFYVPEAVDAELCGAIIEHLFNDHCSNELEVLQSLFGYTEIEFDKSVFGYGE